MDETHALIKEHDMPHVITVVKRYDDPDSYGFHFMEVDPNHFSGYRETQSPYLSSPETTQNKVEEFLGQGFTEFNTPIPDMTEMMQRIVWRSCPIEFHSGLRENEPFITERVRVFVNVFNADETVKDLLGVQR